MSTRVAYPFKRIDEMSATVSHVLADKQTSILNVGNDYVYDCKVAPSAEGWTTMWLKAGVMGGTLVVYWVSGGAGSRELLLRREAVRDLPQGGNEVFSFSFTIPGHQHTEKGAVILRVISAEKRTDDDLGAEQGGILWENTCPIDVRGSGGFMKVEYAATPAGKGLSAGPGEYRYSPDRGYELVVYNSHLPKQLHALGAAFHGAIAVLLERALRHAFARLKELAETNTPTPDRDRDGGELDMLADILDSTGGGRKSPRFLLEQETKEKSHDTNRALSNWCWEVSGSLAMRRTDDWCLSVGLITKADEVK